MFDLHNKTAQTASVVFRLIKTLPASPEATCPNVQDVGFSGDSFSISRPTGP